MSYPDYPNNRLIVNDVDITEKFKMVLVDGYTLEPPAPKTYIVDILGGNGKLDLTESLLGDTAYDNRKQEFTFYLLDLDDTVNFERVKTDVSNFLHGRSYDYVMTIDPEYTYNGRFSVSSYEHSSISNGILGCIKIAIDAKPFKHKEKQKYSIDAVGGNIFHFNSGRERVRPTIETDGFVKVIKNGVLTTLPQGAWTISNLFFENGENDVYINSYDVHNLTWGNLKTNGVTWGAFGEKRLFEWYKSNGNDNIETKTWDEISEKTWADMSVTNWKDLIKMDSIPTTIEDVQIKYDWGDL